MHGVVRGPSPGRRPDAVAVTPDGWPYLPPGARAIEALAAGDCRWPIGELHDASFRFCGAPRERGSYCAAHRALSREGRTR